MFPTRRHRDRFLAFALVGLALPAAAAEQAGVAAAVRGEVVLARAQLASRDVKSGEEILMQDSLRSGARSGMQILLLDETVFTIGPDSAVVVDEFVYDPATSAGKVGATVAKGVFRFVTGKIAKRRPSDMNVALPSGNIGVRGTIVAGRVDDVARASLVILLGDSAGQATRSGSASIEVCNAGDCERVASPGFGVRIDGPTSPPSDPFRVPPEQIEAILRALANPEEVQDGLAGPLDLPKVGTLDEDERIRNARRGLQGLDSLDGLSDQAAQDARGISDLQRPTAPPPIVTQEPVAPPPTGPSDPSGSTGGGFKP